MKIEVIITSDRYPDGFAKTKVVFNDGSVQRILDVSLGKFRLQCGTPGVSSLDFLLIASTCYAIDKNVSREKSPDNWTREFDVEIPVVNPDIWSQVGPDLMNAMNFLTGDIWNFSFKEVGVQLYRIPYHRRRRWRRLPEFSLCKKPRSICLFSGGLDSAVGAVDLLKKEAKCPVLLIGHYDTPGAKTTQQLLFRSIRSVYDRDRVGLLQMRVSNRPQEAEETSLRSRSLVFMALGICAAGCFGENIPLYTPENGLIAINIPLSPSRSGSCSTRTMHPYFLGRLQALLKGIGINNPIVNPFQFKTKGESLNECLDPDVINSIARTTVSCSHPSRRQNWKRKSANNCGYCIPCIIRRAALHKIGIDNGKDYGIDICEGEIKVTDQNDSADDLRAIVNFIRSGFDNIKLKRAIVQISPVDSLNEISSVAERGFKEIMKLLLEKGNKEIQNLINSKNA